MVVSADLFQQILALETSLHRPEIRQSHVHVGRLLAANFFEFGRSGLVYDRASTIEALAAEDPKATEALPEVHEGTCRLLADDCVLLTYRSIRRTTKSTVETLRSSIWKKVDGDWRLVFNQGTPVQPALATDGAVR